MRDRRPELDERTVREVLSLLGERLGVGLVIVASAGEVLFASPRARRLLGASASLPAPLHRLLQALASGGEDTDRERIALAGARHPIEVRATRLRGTGGRALLTLEEERPRSDLASALVEQFGISARSVQLVQLARLGLRNNEIGQRLGLSEATVKTYMHGLFREVGVRNRAELVALAERLAAGGRGR